MVAETEAAAGVHNNQPTDGRDSDRNSIRGGGSGNGGSHDSGSGDGSNGAATAAAQTVAVAMAAHEIYIKRGRKQRSWWQWWQRRVMAA